VLALKHIWARSRAAQALVQTGASTARLPDARSSTGPDRPPAHSGVARGGEAVHVRRRRRGRRGVRVNAAHRAVPARGRAAGAPRGLERSGREPRPSRKAASVFVCVDRTGVFVARMIAFLRLDAHLRPIFELHGWGDLRTPARSRKRAASGRRRRSSSATTSWTHSRSRLRPGRPRGAHCAAATRPARPRHVYTLDPRSRARRRIPHS